MIKSYKGFDKDMTCRGFQYEIGKEYEEENAKACECGFHACEYPLDCFRYYAPSQSEFCEVEQSGKISKSDEGTKVSSSKIKIGAKLDIADIVEAAIEFTKSKAINENNTTGEHCINLATDAYSVISATGDYSVSSATGYRSVSSVTGYKGASSATGDYSISSSTGYMGVSSASGYMGISSATGYMAISSATGCRGVSSVTGYKGASSAENPTAIAVAWGYKSRAKGVIGSYIVCAEWKENDNYECNFVQAKMVQVDGVKIKADTYYELIDGEFVEAKD